MYRADVFFVLLLGGWKRISFVMGRRQTAPTEGGRLEENNQVISTIKKMFEELKSSLQGEVGELKKSVEFMSLKFDHLREELAQARSDLKATQDELRTLAKENEVLKQEVSELQQYTRRDNVMVFGVPESEHETTYDVINTLSAVIGAEAAIQDVSIAHRLPAKPGKTRPIVIRFSKRRSRDQWLQSFKNEARKDDSGPGISAQKLKAQLPGRITAGEQLTVANRELLNKTRDAAHIKGYQFVWTRDGKVFVRKDERSPVSKITCLQDVNSL